eukprot:366189-Chlamydomonas_euryale.AAC.7
MDSTGLLTHTRLPLPSSLPPPTLTSLSQPPDTHPPSSHILILLPPPTPSLVQPIVTLSPAPFTHIRPAPPPHLPICERSFGVRVKMCDSEECAPGGTYVCTVKFIDQSNNNVGCSGMQRRTVHTISE